MDGRGSERRSEPRADPRLRTSTRLKAQAYGQDEHGDHWRWLRGPHEPPPRHTERQTSEAFRPSEGCRELPGNRFDKHDDFGVCFQKDARASPRLLRRSAPPSCSFLVCPTSSDVTGRPRSRLPAVRDSGARALSRVVPAEGCPTRVAARSQPASQPAFRARSRRATEDERAGRPRVERGRRVSTRARGLR